MLVPDLSSMWKKEKENNNLEKSFMACKLELLFPALEKIIHASTRGSPRLMTC